MKKWKFLKGCLGWNFYFEINKRACPFFGKVRHESLKAQETKKLALAGICTPIVCVEDRCPCHITNASVQTRGKKLDRE